MGQSLYASKKASSFVSVLSGASRSAVIKTAVQLNDCGLWLTVNQNKDSSLALDGKPCTSTCTSCHQTDISALRLFRYLLHADSIVVDSPFKLTA